jgi:hypothetical protein
METQNVQADAKGNYIVQLGATKPDGLPLDLFTSGEARWLGVTINGGEEQPRILLLSVPYALKAADAETVGGLPASAFMLANKSPENVAATQTALTPNATKNAPALSLNPAVTGKGVAGFLPMWDSASDIVNSVVSQKNLLVGINTTAPAATLRCQRQGRRARYPDVVSQGGRSHSGHQRDDFYGGSIRQGNLHCRTNLSAYDCRRKSGN